MAKPKDKEKVEAAAETLTDTKVEKKRDWMRELAKFDGAVTERRDIHASVLRCGSPSVNAMFGNGWGLPRGFTLLLAGEPKGGKSTLINSFIGELHRQDPQAIAVKIDSEFREEAQTAPDDLTKWGIDVARYLAFQRDDPNVVDLIDRDLTRLAQDGMPIALLVIDSINGIEGFRSFNAENAEKQASQIGDSAKLQQQLMACVLRFCRRFRVGCIVSSHVAAEMDLVEQMRGNKYRAKSSLGAQHRIEYWAFIEKNRTKEGRTSLLGKEYVREGGVQMVRREGEMQPDTYAHKIRVKMMNSSFGPAGRLAEFTYDYARGIINQHEEVYLLARSSGILQVAGGVHTFRDLRWKSKEDCVQGLGADPAACLAMLEELQRTEPGHPLCTSPVR